MAIPAHHQPVTDAHSGCRVTLRPFVQIDVVNRALYSSRNAISVSPGALIARPCTARLARVCVLIQTGNMRAA